VPTLIALETTHRDWDSNLGRARANRARVDVNNPQAGKGCNGNHPRIARRRKLKHPIPISPSKKCGGEKKEMPTRAAGQKSTPAKKETRCKRSGRGQM